MSTRRSWQEVREELVAGDPELDGEIRAGAAAIVMKPQARRAAPQPPGQPGIGGRGDGRHV